MEIKKSLQRILEKLQKSPTLVKILGIITSIKFLTLILIIVTIFSIIATANITRVSLYLEEARQRESIKTEISNTQKVISELKANEGILEYLYGKIDEYKTNDYYYAETDTISTVNLENSNTLHGLSDELTIEVDSYLSAFRLLKAQIENVKKNAANRELKNESIDSAKGLLNIILNGGTDISDKQIYGLHDLITKFEQYNQENEKKLSALHQDIQNLNIK